MNSLWIKQCFLCGVNSLSTDNFVLERNEVTEDGL